VLVGIGHTYYWAGAGGPGPAPYDGSYKPIYRPRRRFNWLLPWVPWVVGVINATIKTTLALFTSVVAVGPGYVRAVFNCHVAYRVTTPR